MSDQPQTINGELLRLQREARGWLVSDLATRACMSVKQIRQLEEGGSSSFYSESVKFTSAKKVGALLGLTPEEVFGVSQATEAVQPAEDTRSVVDIPPDVAQPVSESVQETPSQETMGADAAQTIQSVRDNAPALSAADTSQAPVETKNKTPLGAIAALFVAALAVAAWMRPETESVSVEPPPPLQVLPAEAEAAASAASAEAAAMAASGASAPTAVPTAATPAPAPAAAASVSVPPSASTPPASAASAAKPL